MSGGGRGWGSHVSCSGGEGRGSQVWGDWVQGALYSELQCIMGNGHMETSLVDRMTDRPDWKHYIPTTSLVGSKNRVVPPPSGSGIPGEILDPQLTVNVAFPFAYCQWFCNNLYDLLYPLSLSECTSHNAVWILVGKPLLARKVSKWTNQISFNSNNELCIAANVLVW